MMGEEESESVRWVLVNLRVDEESGRDKGSGWVR